MKKLLLASACLVFLAPVFAQEKATETTPKKVTTTKKKVAKKLDTKKVTTVSKVEKGAATAEKVAEKPIEAVTVPETKPMAAIPQQVTPPPPPAPMLDPNKDFEFKNDAYDFGKIPAGKQAKYELWIKNISKETQELTLVQPGCGCTTPEYQQGQKIAPGESAKVVLGFNGGAPGSSTPFSKSVTVTLKGHSPKYVTFKGETYAVPTESAPANNATEKLKPEGGK